MLLFLALTQAAAPPDIELRARVRADRVTVDQRGRATLTVRAEPDGGSAVRVDAPPAATELRDVTITVDAAARLAAPAAAPDAANTATPQGE